MSRLEEALRRAGISAGVREDTVTPDPYALERFPAGDVTAHAPVSTVSVLPDARTTQLDDEFRLSDPPVGRRPLSMGSGTRAIGSRESAEKLVVHGGLPHEAGEQYRRIAATLHQRQREKGLRVLMVTSAVPGEGKTLTALNLALTLSESYGRRVLLIDADLRRPMLLKVVGVSEPRFGLSGLLRGNHDLQLTTVSVSDRLDLVPPGSPDPDPMKGLTSERMQRLVADAATRYDWVIIDTPPAAVLPDASLLKTMVDGAILVIGAGRTPLALVLRAVEAVGRDRILGVVLNRVEPSNMPLEYGYTYHAYGGVANTGV